MQHNLIVFVALFALSSPLFAQVTNQDNSQIIETDAPQSGEAESYANYYLDTKRDGLEPFWKAAVKFKLHENNFIVNYRDMHKNKDSALLESLIHPTSKLCENEMRKPYFDSMREFYLTEKFPNDFKVKYFPIDAQKGWELKQNQEFPVAPTHILYIEYKDGDYVEGLQRFIRYEEYPEPTMYEVLKCPSEASMAQMAAEAEAMLKEMGQE